MGKVKEYYNQDQEYYAQDQEFYNQDYDVDTAVEQEIKIGETVFIYDSKFGEEPRLGLVLLVQNIGQDKVLSVELESSKTVMQVHDIQCRRVEARVPRQIWALISSEGAVEDFVLGAPPSKDYVLFREVLRSNNGGEVCL